MKWAKVASFCSAISGKGLDTDHNSSEMIANTMKAITSHFAASADIPATPRAPRIQATIANTKKTTAKYIKSAIFIT
jgi:hypothetical protein